jgi:hypothetical protein
VGPALRQDIGGFVSGGDGTGGMIGKLARSNRTELILCLAYPLPPCRPWVP